MRQLLERLGGLLPATIALALPTVWIPSAVDSFVLPRASIVVAGACVGLGVALLTPGGPSLGAMRWPLVGAALGAILAFATSVSWPLSFAGAYTRYESLPVRLGYLGLFATSVWLLRNRRSRDWVVAAFVFGTAVACFESLLQRVGGVAFRPDGNLGNANLLAALIAMALPLAIDRGLRGGTFVVAWWIGAIDIALGLITTTSRSGGLGALVACLALAVFALRGRWAVPAAIASLAVSAVALVVILVSPLRLLNDDPAALRLHLWRDALHMLVARPLTGWGEDSTGLAFGQFLSGDWAPGVTFDRVHSGPLDIAITQGLVELAVLGWVLATLMRGAWRRRFTLGLGAPAAACIGYAVWVLFNFDWAPATGAFWLLAGVAWSAVREAETVAETPARSAPANVPVPFTRTSLAVVMALAAVWIGAMPVLADVWYYQGRADLSVIVDPLQARYHWALGESFVSRGSPQRGVDELRRAADLGETDPSLYVDLGDLEARLGRVAQARADYRRALAIDPYFAPARQRLATI
jgi:O-Antigen ligase